MRRLLMSLVTVLVLALVAPNASVLATPTTPAQTYRAQHIYVTPDGEHLITVSIRESDDRDAVAAIVSEEGARFLLRAVSAAFQADPTTFVNITDRVNVRYADRFIVMRGTSTIEGEDYDTHLIVTSKDNRLFIFFGLNPTDTFLRYVNACNRMGNARPVPKGCIEYPID